MSTVEIAADCSCQSIGRTDLRQCPTHHSIWAGDRKLTSVSSIIRMCFPQETCKSCGAVGYNHKPGCVIGEKIENAKERGTAVDQLFVSYVTGKLDKIPAGTRTDVFNDKPPHDGLLQKLMRWFHRQNFKTVETQVLLAGEDHGGILDLRLDGVPFELKATYDISNEHRMQAAGYANLAKSHGNIIHVTERYAEPRIVPLTQADYQDWEIVLAHFRMLKRRGLPTKNEQ